jgi:hypothetical protein
MSNSFIRPILILLLALLSLTNQAQISVGVDAGITRMKFSGDPPDGLGFFSPQPGYSSSLQLAYRFNNGFGLNIRPGYSVLRSKYSFLNDSATKVVDSTYFKVENFSLPLNAVVWSPGGRFYVIAGIEFTYVINIDAEVVSSPLLQSVPSYEIRDYNFYAHFGAGFIIPLGRPFLSFELRYSQGLNDLTDPLIHLQSELPRTKLTNINLLIGLHIPLGDPDVFSIQEKIK